MENKFLILTSPRARSSWMATWLTYDKVFCVHELLKLCPSFTDFYIAMDISEADERYKYFGSSDAANVLFADKLLQITGPSTKVVVIYRPFEEWVEAGTKTFGGRPPDEILELYEAAMQRVLANYDALKIRFKDLNKFKTLDKIWKFIAPDIPHNRERTLQLMTMNIQPDKATMIGNAEKFSINLQKLLEEYNNED